MASRISSGMKDLAVDARAGSRPTPPPPGARQRPMSARMADRAELERSHDGAARELFSGTAPPPSGGPDLSPSVRSRARPQSAQTTGGYSSPPPSLSHTHSLSLSLDHSLSLALYFLSHILSLPILSH